MGALCVYWLTKARHHKPKIVAHYFVN